LTPPPARAKALQTTWLMIFLRARGSLTLSIEPSGGGRYPQRLCGNIFGSVPIEHELSCPKSDETARPPVRGERSSIDPCFQHPLIAE